MARKKPQRKKRTEYIYGTTSGEVSELVITVDERTGEISFGHHMTNVHSEVSYERAKGPKVLSRVPQLGDWLNFDIERAITSNFDILCAVDTNTRIVNGQKLSVVGVVTFKEAPPPPGATRYWKLDVPFCWEFVGLKTDKPENFGWSAAWEQLCREGLVKPSLRVGMVVDSDLGNLVDYNHRREPFFEKDMLPDNLQLIYASADTGQENLINRVLSVADSVSSQVLDAVASGKIAPNLNKLDTAWYEGQRLVRVDAETYEARY